MSIEYTKPQIEDYGSLEELTALIAGNCSDQISGPVGPAFPASNCATITSVT
jgi:hypothetical protein